MNAAFMPPASDSQSAPLRTGVPEEAARGVPPPGPRHRSPWHRLIRWVQENTFAPEWLPERLRHPVIGYLAAMLVQGAAAGVILAALSMVRDFDYYAIVALLGVVFVALGWGVGPGLFATLVGTLLLDFVAGTPKFSWAVNNLADASGMAMYLVVGVIVSQLAGQKERARRGTAKTAQLLTEMEARSRVDADRLRTVLDVLPAAVVITNQEGRLQVMNQASRILWGDDIPPGTDLTQLARSNYQDKLRWVSSGRPLTPGEWPLARALSGGESVLNEELEIEAVDGQRKVLLTSAAPIRDESGAMAGAVMLLRDITERRLLEHKVAEHAQELEAIFETMTDGIAVLDVDGRLVGTNRAFRALHGIEPDSEYMTLTLQQRLSSLAPHGAHGEAVAMHDWPSMRLLRGDSLTGVDINIKNLRGREIVLNVGGAPIRDQRGRITGCVEVFRDVTARQHLEQRTRETLGTLVAMAEAMVQIRPPAPSVDEVGAAATAIAADTTMALVARRLAELTRSVLGCRRVNLAAVDPLSGRLHPVIEVGLHPEEAAAWWASWTPPQRLEQRFGSAIAAVLAAGQPAHLDRRSQPERAFDLLFGADSGWLVPMRLGEELVGILLVDYPEPEHDYSREEEILLTTTLAQLGALVLERDRLLRGWAETRASELALQDTKAQMDTFLGIASHELKTPLTSLKLSLQLSQRRLNRLTRDQPSTSPLGDDLGLQAAVEQMSRTAHQMERLETLVNDLVDVSRIQAGQLELHLAPTNLVALVREAVEIQQQAAPDRRLLLQLPAPADRPLEVEGDGGRLEQVVTNFLTNALKYSPATAPVEVGLELQTDLAATQPLQVRVWVHDQGPGLPHSQQAQIWERFHRVPGVEVQSGTGVGLGLGLYICRMIIERHHGQVGVHSTPGQGSTFWFSLPLQYAARHDQ